MSRPHKFFFNPGGDQSKVAEATPEAYDSIHQTLEALERLRTTRDSAIRQVQAAEKSCKHEFFYDEAGIPYDTRVCASCGMCIGMV